MAYGFGEYGGLPDWLVFGNQQEQYRPNALEGSTPTTGMFDDRWGGVPQGLASGMFDPQGSNFLGEGAYGSRPGFNLPPQFPPPTMSPGATQFAGQSPAMGYAPEAPMPQPRPDMPPQIQYAQAQAPQQAPPSMGDRLATGAQGFATLAFPPLGALIQGLRTGQTPAERDRQAVQQAVKAAGGTDAQALAAAANPDVFKAIAPDLFGAPKVVLTNEEEDMLGNKRKTYQLQQGHKFSPIPGQGPPGGANTAGGVTIDENKTGEDYISQFPQNIQAAVRAYHSGEAMPSGNPRKGFTQLVKQVAARYGEDIGEPISEAIFAQKRQLRNQLASGTSASLGGQINTGRTSIGHLADISDAALELPNIGTGGLAGIPGSATAARLVNRIIQTSGDNSPAVKRFQDMRQRYIEEITKFYAGGPGAQAERDRALSSFDSAGTPQELAAVIRAEAKLMNSKISTIDSQVTDVLGARNATKFKAVNEDTQKALDRIEANAIKLNEGGNKPAKAQELPVVSSPAEAAKLPKGTKFRDPQGNIRTVP